MLVSQYFIQQHLSQPLSQQFPVLIERSVHGSTVVMGYGRTAQDAADSIRRNARAFGYYDLICTSPATDEEAAPDRGTGR